MRFPIHYEAIDWGDPAILPESIASIQAIAKAVQHELQEVGHVGFGARCPNDLEATGNAL